MSNLATVYGMRDMECDPSSVPFHSDPITQEINVNEH